MCLYALFTGFLNASAKKVLVKYQYASQNAKHIAKYDFLMSQLSVSDESLDRVSQKIFVVFAVVMLPALVASIARGFESDGAFGVVAMQITLYIWILVLAMPLRRFNYRQRLYSAFAISFFIGAGALIRNSDLSVLGWFVLASVLLSSVSVGRLRYIFIAIIFPAATFLSHHLWGGDLNYAISAGFAYAAMSLVVTLLVSTLVSSAKESAASEQKLRTERDRALQQLQIEEQRRTAVSENANVAFFQFDYASGRCYGDATELARHGLTPDAEFWDVAKDAYLFAPDSQEQMQIQITEMSQQPVGARAQFTLQMRVQPSNELRSLRISGLNVEVDGALLFAGASIDITEEAAAREEAQRQAQQLDLLARSGDVAYFEVDLERGLIDGNALLKQRAGLPADAPAFPMAEIVASIPAEARPEFESNVQRAIEAGLGGVTTFEHPYYKDDGELIHLRVTATTQMREGRLHALGASVEITEAVRAKQQAEQQAEQLKLITEQGKIGLYEFDLEKGVMHANSVLCERFGVDPEIGEVSQERMLEGLTEDARPSALEHIERGKTAPEGYFGTSTVDHIFSDGSVHKIRIFEKLEHREGRPFYVGAGVDVTDEVEAREQAVAAMSKLAQEQDRQAQMYAVIGHELRTPAASLQMMLDDLGEGETLDSALTRANIEQLLSVIDTLRAVAQPERMAQATYDDVQLDEMLQQQAQNFQPFAARQGVSLKTDFTGLTIHPVHIQKTLLRQVLSNLIKNALIHSGATELEVGASGRLLDGQRKALRLWIADNGQGVSADKEEKLFEAFVRGFTEAEGTGLGLHICREIIQNMGGDLRYEPRPEGGACFVIELEVDLAKADPSKQLKPQANESPLQGMWVLLAEDNKTIQMLTQKMLEKQGAQVSVCNNGKEALEAFEPGKFDLVLSDIFMPEMNGYEFAREVRCVDTVVPLIGLTAATIGKETDEMLAAGASAVLSKPINISLLLAKLAELEQTPTSA